MYYLISRDESKMRFQVGALRTKNRTNAARIVASTFGVLVGLAGIEHGFFEILQGDVEPGSIMIEAIGSAQRFWEYGVETALTLIPSFLLSGILSIIVGLMVIVWSIVFIDRKHGGWVLFLLCIILFMVGGGFAPIFMSILASITATRINKPLKDLGRALPESVLRFLSNIWLWSLIAFVVLFIISVEIAIFGWPINAFFDAQTSLNYLNILAYVMLGLMILSVITGLVHDMGESRDGI